MRHQSTRARPRAWYAEREVRVLGVDYGRKRIGLAVSDATGLLARPWKTIRVSGDVVAATRQLAREVDALIAEPEGLAAVVVGYPRRLSGEPNEQTRTVEQLAAVLRAERPIDVVLQDERLSSHEADAVLSRTHRDWRLRKPLLDAMAAAIILQDYLDTRPRVPPPTPT